MKREKRMKKSEKIDLIRKMATEDLPAQIKVCNANPGDQKARRDLEYLKTQMTMVIIETAIGAHTVEEKKTGKWHYVFTQKLCTIGELNEICNIFEKYMKDHEIPFINSQDDFGGDMAIPSTSANESAVDHIEVNKLTRKNFSDAIYDHINKYKSINRAVIMELADYGEKLRKKQNIQLALIVGGIMILAAGGAVTGTVLYRKKHDGSYEEIDIPDDIPEVDVDDIPEVDVDDIPDDIPEVDTSAVEIV